MSVPLEEKFASLDAIYLDSEGSVWLNQAKSSGSFGVFETLEDLAQIEESYAPLEKYVPVNRQKNKRLYRLKINKRGSTQFLSKGEARGREKTYQVLPAALKRLGKLRRNGWDVDLEVIEHKVIGLHEWGKNDQHITG